MALTAFVNGGPMVRKAVLSDAILQNSPTALASNASNALYFFRGIKTPATLIAGSSLAALFTMTKDVKQTYAMPKMQVILLRIYHALSLLSFCLSLSAVLCSQAAMTSLLLEEQQMVAKKAKSTWDFMRMALNFEFILARWSYLTSILLFLTSTTFRMIIQFGLFTRTRRLAGTMVVSFMTGILGSILSYLNTSEKAFPNMWGMTKEVGKMFWVRAYVDRHPLQIASTAFFAVAALCSLVFLLPRTIEQDQFLDHESYT